MTPREERIRTLCLFLRTGAPEPSALSPLAFDSDLYTEAMLAADVEREEAVKKGHARLPMRHLGCYHELRRNAPPVAKPFIQMNFFFWARKYLGSTDNVSVSLILARIWHAPTWRQAWRCGLARIGRTCDFTTNRRQYAKIWRLFAMRTPSGVNAGFRALASQRQGQG